ncbi:helix-turn-helix domain-containing protein [Acinetobacter rudis]|uniref:helix-turn-helix domain-containing protein n=1 Tax=Acinetobacter rudis TaxID=632955 RepID=UPI003341CFF5
MDSFQTKVFVAEEHCSMIGTQLLAQSHRHSAIHIVISLQKHTPIQAVVQGQRIGVQAMMIQSHCLHELKIQSPYWLVLLNRMSTLGICINAFLKQQSTSYLSLSFDEAQLDQLYTACRNLENKAEYLKLWQVLKQSLPTHLCQLEHPPLDKRIMRLMQLKHDVLFMDNKINWSHIHADLNLSTSRFSHLFSQTTGGTVKQYFLFNQLMLALTEVASGGSITAAAMKHGFDSPSHLSSTCRKLMGIKPSDVKNIKFI